MARRKQSGAAAADSASDERYASIVAQMKDAPGVDEGRMFGSTGLRVNGKVFAMLVKGALVAKLPAGRCSALVEAGKAQLFDPGHGRLMKEWIQTTDGTAAHWRKLAEEAFEFVRQGTQSASGAKKKPAR
jgi:TfoX/Sxy family transcriptional regulator of competence genes